MENGSLVIYLEANRKKKIARFAAAWADDPTSAPFCGDCISQISTSKSCDASCYQMDLEDFIGGFIFWMKDSRKEVNSIVLVGFDIEKRAETLRNVMVHQIKSRDLKFNNYFSPQLIDLSSLVYAEHLKREAPVPRVADFVYSLGYAGMSNHKLSEDEHPLAKAKAMLEAEIFSRIAFGRRYFSEFKKYPVPNYLERMHK